MEERRVCDTLEVYLQHENGGEQEFKYKLSDEEKALMLPKMEDYCQHKWNQSLEECCADYLREQEPATPTMQMSRSAPACVALCAAIPVQVASLPIQRWKRPFQGFWTILPE